MPAEEANVCVKPSLDRAQLLSCADGLLFGPEGPRLPAPPMLMFDRITHIAEVGGDHGAGQLTAELDVDPEQWFFSCHFRGDPVMPGCLGLDALWQLLGFFLGWRGGKGRGRALGCKSVDFRGEITPDTRLVTYALSIKRIIQRARNSLGIADGIVYADGKLIYQATGLKVGLFPYPSPSSPEAS